MSLRNVIRFGVLALFGGCFVFHLEVRGADGWPEFRGPAGRGHANCSGLPLTWSEEENVTWKIPVPGQGWSSPVVEAGQIWMTTAIDTPASKEDAERRLRANTGNQPLSLAEEVSLRAVCVDLKSGKLLHDIELMTEKEPQWVHVLNSYATPTPVLEDGRLYAHFGTYGTACLDTKSGRVLWTNRDLRIMHENGPASSPIVIDDLVVFHCDGSDEQYVVALAKDTGRVVWKTHRSGEMHQNPQLKKSYGTPTVVTVNGQKQLISPAANWLYAYDPATGRELWKVSYGVLGFSVIPRPVVGHGLIYTVTCFMKSELLAVRYDTDGAGNGPHIAWRYTHQAPQKPSPLLVGDELYLISDKTGIATCLDARTGDLHWRERLGGNYSASPLYADGRVYFFSHEGISHVVQASPQYKHLATNQLDGTHMASPAVADGALLLRTEETLYRIESSPAGGPE